MTKAAKRARLADAIRRARKSRGLTQGRLGELVGCSDKTIARIEHGENCSGTLLALITKELDLTINDGIEREVRKPRKAPKP